MSPMEGCRKLQPDAQCQAHTLLMTIMGPQGPHMKQSIDGHHMPLTVTSLGPRPICTSPPVPSIQMASHLTQCLPPPRLPPQLLAPVTCPPEVTDLHNPTHPLGPCQHQWVYIRNGVQQVIFVTCLLDQTKCQSTAGQTPGL